MNEGSLIREIWQENRKLIALLGAVTLALLVLFSVLLIVKSVSGNNSEPEISQDTQEGSVAEATESDLELDLYYNDIYDTVNHVCRYKMDNCVIGKGKLLTDGTWYITTIKEPMGTPWSLPKDTYRVVVRRLAGVWRIEAGPSLVFSYGDYPNIPKEILKSANNLD